MPPNYVGLRRVMSATPASATLDSRPRLAPQRMLNGVVRVEASHAALPVRMTLKYLEARTAEVEYDQFLVNRVRGGKKVVFGGP